MPSHKRYRKRRLVFDYRRMNARVKRSTYYCRHSTDVLAVAVGFVWYTFVDVVSRLNQIRNTKRAREVLAIVARSDKYLPVGLTFGPVNGPDDFNFVVDRAFSPGEGRKLRFSKEWVAYVDGLTVRTGRVVDGRFRTDAEVEREIRQACTKGALAVPQGVGSALEALGVNTNLKGTGKAKRDEATSHHNHPTRACGLGGLGEWWVLWAGVCSVCSGVFAALVAAPDVPIRTRLSLGRRVLSMMTVFMFLSMFLRRHSVRSAGNVVDHEQLQSHVPSAISSAQHLYDPQRQRARDSGPQCSLAPYCKRIRSAEWDLRFAFLLTESFHPAKLPSSASPVLGRTQRFAGPADTMVRFAPARWATDTADLERGLVKGLRHGAFKFRGCLALGGWIPLRVASDRLRVTITRTQDAIIWIAGILSPGCSTTLRMRH